MRIVLISLVFVLTACSTLTTAPDNSIAPSITSISPDTAAPFQQITLTGRNFTTSDTLIVGGYRITNTIIESTPVSITFYMPSEMPAQNYLPPVPLGAGTYPVHIVGQHGESNTVFLQLQKRARRLPE